MVIGISPVIITMVAPRDLCPRTPVCLTRVGTVMVVDVSPVIITMMAPRDRSAAAVIATATALPALAGPVLTRFDDWFFIATVVGGDQLGPVLAGRPAAN